MIDYGILNSELPSINDYYKSNDGNYYKKEDILNDPNTQIIDKNKNPILNKVWEETKATGNALGAFGADMIGADNLKNDFIKDTQANLDKSSIYNQNYFDASKLENASDVGNYLAYQGLNAGVGLATTLIPGGIIGKGASLLSKQILKKELADSIQKNAFKLGIGVAGGLQNLGSVNSENISDTGQNISGGQALASFGSGAALSAVEIPALLSATGGAKTALGKLGTGFASGAAIGGGSGVAQTALNRATLDKDLTNEEAMNQYLNAGVGGAVGGGVLSGGANVFSKDNVSTSNIESKPLETTNIENNQPIENSYNLTNFKKDFDSLLSNEDYSKNIENIDLNNQEINQPKFLNYEENKVNFDFINNDKNKEILSNIENSLKQEDGTISENKLNLLNNIVNSINNEESNTVKRVLLNNFEKEIKSENFSDLKASKLNELFNEKLNKKTEETLNNQETKLNIDENNIKDFNNIENEINNINKVENNNEIIQNNDTLSKSLSDTIKIADNSEKIANNDINLNSIDSRFKDLTDENKVIYSASKKGDFSKINSDNIYNYINDVKSKVPLNDLEKITRTKIENSIKPISDKVNVGIDIVSNEHSPFNGSKNAFFDEKNNKVVLFTTKDTKENLSNVLMHELFHKGISNIISEKGKDFYKSEMESLYNNQIIKKYADEFSNQGLDKFTSIEEAIGKVIETRELENNQTFFNKMLDTIRKIFNDVIGKEGFKTNQDIIDYYNSRLENVLGNENKKDVELINKNYEEYNNQLKFSSSISDSQKSQIETIANNITEQRMLRDNMNFVEKGFDDKNLDKVYIEEFNKKTNGGFARKFMNNVLNVNAILRKNGGDFIADKLNLRDSFVKSISNNLSKNFKDADIIAKTLTKNESLSVFNAVAKFAYKEDGGVGIRATPEQMKAELSKNFNGKKLQDAFELTEKIREFADNSIYTKKYNDSLISINQLKSLFKNNSIITEKLNNLIESVSINKIKDTDPNVLTMENFEKTLYQIMNDGLETLNLEKDKNETEIKTLENIKTRIDDIVNQSKDLYDRGYIPKDHSGKYVINFYVETDKGLKSVMILADDDQKEMGKLFSKYKQQYGDKFKIEAEVRSENVNSNFDVSKAIDVLQKEGVVFYDEQLKAIAELNELGIQEDMSRKYKGEGFNRDILNVITKQTKQQLNEINSSLFSTDIYGFINSLPRNSGQRDLMVNLLSQYDNNLKSSDAIVDKSAKSLRTLSSMFSLGFNVMNGVAQVIQTKTISLAYFSKYGVGDKFIDANKYYDFKNNKINIEEVRKLGNKELNDFLKTNEFNELLGSSMTDNLLDTKASTFKSKNLYDKFKEKSFKYTSEIPEKVLRFETVLKSAEAYKKVMEGTDENLKSELSKKGFNSFILQSLEEVNGDFSKGQRGKIFQGEIAQTLLMFQQWKSITLNAFSNFDNKQKALYIGSIVLGGGLMGAPFADDFIESFDFLAKIFGYNMPAKKAFNTMINEVAGDNEFMKRYLSYGLPYVGDRTGLGQLIPSYKGLLELANGDKQAGADLLGPSFNTLTNLASASTGIAKNLEQGDLKGASVSAIKAMPSSIKNVLNTAINYDKGYTIDSYGNKKYNISLYDAALQSIGTKSNENFNKEKEIALVKEYRRNANEIKQEYVKDIKSALLDKDNQKANEIVKLAKENGYDIKIADLRRKQLRSKDGTENILNNLSLKERLKIKKDLGL